MDLAGLHQVAISGEALVDLVWETLGSLFKTIFHTLRMAVSAWPWRSALVRMGVSALQAWGGGRRAAWRGPRVLTLHVPLSVPQYRPDADVLAVQPQDASNLPGDRGPAQGRPAPQLSWGVLLPQRGEQGAREWGAGNGVWGHGERAPGPVLACAERGGRGPGWRVGAGAKAKLWRAHPLHPHERGQEKWTDSYSAPVKSFLTIPASGGRVPEFTSLWFEGLQKTQDFHLTLPQCQTELRDHDYPFLFLFWLQTQWFHCLFDLSSEHLTVNLDGEGVSTAAVLSGHRGFKRRCYYYCYYYYYYYYFP